MTLIDRIQMRLLLRRADTIIRNTREADARRKHLNRPHVQSDHLIGYPTIPQPAPERRAGGNELAVFHLVWIAALAGLVAYVNVYHTDPGLQLACTQIAAK